MLPLEGVTIVACEQAVAAPFATRQLADLGARVIKIERPDTGDFARGYDETVRGMSSHFVWLNRSKESLTLDLKNPDDLLVIRSLLATADVFIQNFAPGAVERLGLCPDALRVANPRLITCSISGYGASGPFRDSKAYDALIQAEAGLMSITGTEADPAKTGIPTADIAAGMYAFSGILTALYSRERSGEGAHLEVSLFDSLVEWMGYPIYYTEYGGTAPRRAGTSHAAIAPYGVFTAGDGMEFVLSIQNEREWVSFCTTVLGDRSIASDPRFVKGNLRVANRDALNETIDHILHTLTGEEMEELLVKARTAYGRLRDIPALVQHPQLTARERWVKVGSPVGPIDALLPAINMSGVTPRMDPIPALGEHSERIRASINQTAFAP